RPELLALLWLLPPLGLLVLALLRARARAVARLGLVGLEVAPSAARLHRRRLLLAWLGLSLCLVALAQPRWGYRWRELRQEGLSLVVVLDVSRSMDAQDVDPSRMERARRELSDLADLLQGDRVGLVLAAAGAYPRMPLTLDVRAFREIARDSGTDTLKAQGSDLGRAIEVAAALLGPAGQADRAILIVSDGEDQVGQAEAAAQAAAEQGIHLYTLGVGTPEGAPIPLAEGGFKKDGAGQVVLTRLDRDLLQRLAQVGEGAYADSVPGDGDLRALYLEGIRGGLKTAEQGVRREKVWNERFAWPLGLGLGLLLLSAGLRAPPARALPAGRRLAALLLVGLLPAALLLPAGPSRAQAPAAPAPSPLDALLAEQARDPDDLDVAERVGQALFEQGDFNRAHEVLTGVADRSLDPEQRTRARTNAGLAAYRAGRLTRAVEDWDRVVKEAPQAEAAKANAQAVRQEIARRMQQQQQDPPQQQQGEQDPPQQQQGEQDPPQQQQQGEQDPQQQQQQGEQDPQQQQGEQDPQPGEEPPGDPGQIQPQDGAPGDTGGQEQEGQVHRPGSMSEQEADRLLDGVEEGKPRVQVDPAARKGGKDW
ncbi:VWA domain-containing protein, partial [Myxococcota bacterium]|nr:VWA domain-containing protein [Myxococcota bacterium]